MIMRVSCCDLGRKGAIFIILLVIVGCFIVGRLELDSVEAKQAEISVDNDISDARSEEQKFPIAMDFIESLGSKLRYAYNIFMETKSKDYDKSIDKTRLSPVILVPGYGGSRLEAKWDRSQVEHYVCESKSDWTNIWLDVKRLLPYMIDCLIELFKLELDHTTNSTRNTAGVEVRVRDPDDLSTVEYLIDLRAPTFGYFALIIKRLENDLGYERNVNLRGAPYDFRKAPNELLDYFRSLKLKTEQSYKLNNRQAVTFICHSMGCNNVLYFLQRQPLAWKEKYVRRVISLAAPWAGSMAALRAAALGDNLGLTYLLNEATLNKAQRSLPSTVYLFPHKDVFSDVPLVRSHVKGPSSKTYSTHNYRDFFSKLNHPDGYIMWLQTKDLLNNLIAPHVEVHCLYGENIQTIGRLEFHGDFPNSSSEVLYDDGDGTVTVQSSTYCKKWSGQQKQPIYAKGIKVDHVDILRRDDVIDYIEKALVPEKETKVVDKTLI